MFAYAQLQNADFALGLGRVFNGAAMRCAFALCALSLSLPLPTDSLFHPPTLTVSQFMSRVLSANNVDDEDSKEEKRIRKQVGPIIINAPKDHFLDVLDLQKNM